MTDLRAAAINDNARWCDLICRLHGVPTALEHGIWFARTSAPANYPNLITLTESTTAAEVAERLADAPTCAVKDSYATLDLAPYGFEVLFAATWIHRAPSVASGAPRGWTTVTTADELATWARAHGTPETFPAEILSERSIRILAKIGDTGEVLGGAVADRSADVVGVSNVFAVPHAVDAVWAGIPDAVAARFPATPLVGYERGEALAAAERAGFGRLAPLRVWVRQA